MHIQCISLLLHRENASQFTHSVLISAFRTKDPISFQKPGGVCHAQGNNGIP